MSERGSFGLYLHIPYCIKKCPYCDFNSYAVGERPSAVELPEDRYCAALEQEITARLSRPEWRGRSCHSLFFGGGTPSLLSAKSYFRLFRVIASLTDLLPACESTMETNPGTVHELLDREKLLQIREAGVNRISLGVQSFSSRKRNLLGRWHSTEDIFAAVENVRSAGFSNYSFDFIFAVPEETEAEWHEDLNTALSLEPRHLSAYGLTIEPGTEFGRLHKKGRFTELDEELQARLYLETGRYLAQHGFERYEISNYALPGRECRHNLGYWQGEDYLGVGAGAHSFLNEGETHHRWVNLPGPEQYITAILTSGTAATRNEVLDREQQKMEFFFLRLRTSAGAAWSDFRRRFGEDLADRYGGTIERLCRDGLLRSDENGMRLTEQGFLFSTSVFEAFATV